MKVITKMRQRGFSLFMVLIILLVIAFLVVAGMQSVNTEMRISSNDADRKVALSLAETALREAEEVIGDLPNNQEFDLACTNGFCVPAGGVPAAPGGITERFSGVGQDAAECRSDSNISLCFQQAWERGNTLEEKGKTLSTAPAGAAQSAQEQKRGSAIKQYTSKTPRYLIEYLGAGLDDRGAVTYMFRVTARAWGQNSNTVVTVQSYVEAQYD